MDYKDIYKDAMEKSLGCATDVPYFEGDFWPNVLEESIKASDISHSIGEFSPLCRCCHESE